MRDQLIVLLALFYISSLSAFEGYWYTQGQESVVEISMSEGVYSGKIVWLKEPFDENGEPWYDTENPDTLLQQQKIAGLPILKELQLKNHSLKNGIIYDPNSGKSYRCIITINDNDLSVRGYIGITLLGRTEKWTKCYKIPREVLQ